MNVRILPIAALLLAGLTARAQHGGAGHAVSAHGGGFHGGSAGVARPGFASGPRFAGSARFAPGGRVGAGYRMGPLPARPTFYTRAGAGGAAYNRLRSRYPVALPHGYGPGSGYGYGRGREHGPRYGYGYVYADPWFNTLSYNYLGDWLDYPDGFDSFYDDAPLTADGAAPYGQPGPDTLQGQYSGPYADGGQYPDEADAGAGYPPPPPGYAAAPYPAYGGSPYAPYANYAPSRSYRGQVAQAPPPPLQQEEPITIFFKDGRPPEQVRNYALTHTTLYITDARMREIPLSELDLPRTEQVNHEAGLDFYPPQ